MREERDYYKDLGLPPDANDDMIKQQYHKLALKYHPDKICHPDTTTEKAMKAEATEKFKVVQNAWEVLRDRDLKAQYDAKSKSNQAHNRGRVRIQPWQMSAPPRAPKIARDNVSAFREYLNEWKEYNDSCIGHFLKRRMSVPEESDLSDDYLSKYFKDLVRDNDALAKWRSAGIEHEKCIQEVLDMAR